MLHQPQSIICACSVKQPHTCCAEVRVQIVFASLLCSHVASRQAPNVHHYCADVTVSCSAVYYVLPCHVAAEPCFSRRFQTRNRQTCCNAELAHPAHEFLHLRMAVDAVEQQSACLWPCKVL